MYKYINTVTDWAGNKITGAFVNVTDNNGGAVTLYSDFAGTTPIGSTLTTDTHGQFSFFAPSGRYSIAVSGTGITSYSINDVTIGDVEGFDARLDALEAQTVLANKLDVTTYGAVCDSTGPGTGTNNAAAVQAAVNYLLTIQSSSRPSLYFPEKIGFKYRIGSSITVNTGTSDAKGFTVEGESKYGGGILYTGTGDLFVFGDGAGTASAQIQFVQFKNIRLDGNSSASGYAVNGSPLVHPRFYDCLLLQWPTAGAMRIGYGFSGSFNANTITACKDGFDFRGIGGTSGQSNAIVLQGNTVYSNTGHGYRLKDCFNWLMNGGTVESNKKSGVFIEAHNKAINIYGTYFELNAIDGVSFSSPAATIRANILINGGTYSDDAAIPISDVYPNSVGVRGTYNSSIHADYHIYAPGSSDGLDITSNIAEIYANVATYVSSTVCTITGDSSAAFGSKFSYTRRRIRYNTANGFRTGIVKAAIYATGTTTVTIEPDTDGFDSTLTQVSWVPALVGCWGGFYHDSPRIKSGSDYLPHLDNVHIEGNVGFYGPAIKIESQAKYLGLATAAITAGDTAITSTFAWSTTTGYLLHDAAGNPFGRLATISGNTVTITGINGSGGANINVPEAHIQGFGVYASSTYGILEYEDCPTRIFADTANQNNILPKQFEEWFDIDSAAPSTVFRRSSSLFSKFPDAHVWELVYATTGGTSAYGCTVVAANYTDLWGKMCTFGIWVKAPTANSGVRLRAYNVLGGTEYTNAYTSATANTDWVYQTIVFKFPKSGSLMFAVSRVGTSNDTVQLALPSLSELGANIPAIWQIEGKYRKHFNLINAPTTGTWKVGDIASSHVCTVAGSPGTWT